MPDAFVQLMQSSRVSPQTRRVLEHRDAVPGYKPAFFQAREWQLIQQLTEAILPQTHPKTEASCAALIDQSLANAEGSGWRYAALPPAADAYRTALQFIADHMPDSANATVLEPHVELLALLKKIQDKQLDTESFPLSLWLEGFKFDVVRHWLSHPDTMAALDYRGFADDRLNAHDSLQEPPQ